MRYISITIIILALLSMLSCSSLYSKATIRKNELHKNLIVDKPIPSNDLLQVLDIKENSFLISEEIKFTTLTPINKRFSQLRYGRKHQICDDSRSLPIIIDTPLADISKIKIAIESPEYEKHGRRIPRVLSTFITSNNFAGFIKTRLNIYKEPPDADPKYYYTNNGLIWVFMYTKRGIFSQYVYVCCPVSY